MTTSDRELIEWLATNVYGATIGRRGDDGPWPALWWDHAHQCYVLEEEDSLRSPWNPLTSHDDAAMLEAKVRERGLDAEICFVTWLRQIVVDGGDCGFSGMIKSPFVAGIELGRCAKPRQICAAIKAAWENDRPS